MAENKMEQVDFWIRFFKEHTNTIGCVELDGLDCREVLALLQELANKKVDKPNKMEAVAQLFGKKLGEEFKIMLFTGRVWIAMFTSKGLKHCHNDSEWLRANDYLNDLLTGQAVIIND